MLIALPTGMFLYLSLANGTYIQPLFTHPPVGWIMLVVAVVLLALGSFWLSRVVKIKF